MKENIYKDVVVDSLRHLTEKNRVRVYSFVIMANHIHIIWQATYGHHLNDVQTSFKKHTSKEFLKLLKADKNLEIYSVNAVDRNHHFWKRNSLEIELFSDAVFIQKLNYIHENPVRAKECNHAAEYKYSSALFYECGIDNFDFVTHYNG